MRGKIVWVTGSSAGVGLHVAKQCAQRGATLAICGRRRAPLQTTLEELQSMGCEAMAVVGDVGDPRQCRSMYEQIVNELGPIDVLVNNAGAHFRGPFMSHSGEFHAEMISVNLQAPILLSSLVLPEMLRRREGAI
ncbi:MAG TPA: ketoacyl reductase, partial [Myxococcales bacterium]|nr:ketoacyl reductase [Myxococcales bacterium]